MEFQLSAALREAVSYAQNATPTQETAQKALRALDLTDLNPNIAHNTVKKMLEQADNHGLASICIAPNVVKTASKLRKQNSAVRIATVINFPDGAHRSFSTEEATVRSTAIDLITSNLNDANQNDLVLDFDGFQDAAMKNDSEKMDKIAAILEAGYKNRGTSTYKIIIGTAAFNDAAMLRDACEFSASFSPSCLKSDTGLHPAGGVTLEKAAIMMDVAKKQGLGVKISAGVKDAFHAAQYQALAQAIYGYDVTGNPNIFRIGASSALPKLLHFVHTARHLDNEHGSDSPSPQY